MTAPLPAPARIRLGEVCATHGLDSAACDALARILVELRDEPSSISSIRDPLAAVDRHVADSLAGLEAGALARAGSVADLGSGAGFPGLALAVALPGSHVTLVESVGRKAAFLRRAATAAGLANATVAEVRAEQWDAGLGAHDAVTARALAPLPTLVEYAAPLLARGGVLVAWKGSPEAGEEADGAAAASALGMELAEVVRTTPFPSARDRRLYVYLKVAPTPPGYPRRAGVAHRRPLRARPSDRDRR